MSTPTTTEKPPIGIMPEWAHKEQRLNDIREAMWRYHKAGITIPSEWIIEDEEIVHWLKMRELKQKLNPSNSRSI